MSNPSSPPETTGALPKPSDLRITEEEWEDVDLPIDILLLTAKDCEFLSCVECLSGRFKSFKPGLGYVYFGKIGNGDKSLKIAVIQCDKGSSGPQGSGLVVSTGIQELKPKAVICVGYCAGLQGMKVKLGDVIISAKLATYASIKVTEGGIIEAGYQVPATPRLSEIIRSANFGWKAPLESSKDLDVKVHKDALLLSGPEVVSSDKRRAELLGRFPLAMGVEMEGEGKISLNNYENCELYLDFLQTTVTSLPLYSLVPRVSVSYFLPFKPTECLFRVVNACKCDRLEIVRFESGILYCYDNSA